MSFDRHRGFWSVSLAAFLWSASGLAAEPLAPLLACRALADSAARLACFDRESANLAGATAAVGATAGASAGSGPSAPVIPAASPRAPAPVPAPVPARAPASAPAAAPGGTPAAVVSAPANSKENFGLSLAAISQKEVAAGARPAELASIDAHIVAVSATGTGFATFTLDNGQVWRQLTPDGDLLSKPGDDVNVSRGLFRSYWLQNKNGRGCKVVRIQ
jgi:hypothetical protein